MAGTVTIAEKTHGSIKRVTFSWTSSAGGAADGTTTLPFDGKVILLETDPGATAPTDNYDVTVTDDEGHDVLLGAGANRDTADTEYVSEPNLGVVAHSKLTLAVTNAGNAKQGTVTLWIR